jgi:curli production assembly/transport component CsgE
MFAKPNSIDSELSWLMVIYLVITVQIPGVGQNVAAAPSDGIEINGLVVDETITKVGRDFYELFFQYWEAPTGTLSYTLFVREKPLNGLGSQVIIEVNDTEVFVQALQPRYDVVDAVAQYAVGLIQSYIEN